MQQEKQVFFCWLCGMSWIILSGSHLGFPRLQENILGLKLTKAAEQILYQRSLFSIPNARGRLRGYKTDAERGIRGQKYLVRILLASHLSNPPKVSETKVLHTELVIFALQVIWWPCPGKGLSKAIDACDREFIKPLF